jgi:hypothetical protein
MLQALIAHGLAYTGGKPPAHGHGRLRRYVSGGKACPSRGYGECDIQLIGSFISSFCIISVSSGTIEVYITS